MRKFQISAAIAAFFLASLWTGARGQESTVYLSKPFQAGARSIGFAGAITGDAPDVSVMYGNPAALAFLDNSSILITHTYERSSNVMDENVAAPLFLRRGEVVGIAASVGHVGYLSRTPKNDFKVMQYGYDVSYSRRIIPTLSLGGTLNVRYARSSDSKLWGLSSSFGLFYFPTPEVSYGAALTGVGSGIKYIFDGERTLLNSGNISRSILVGAVMRFPTKAAKARMFNISLAAEKMFDRPEIRYFGGLEILPVRFISFRVGYFRAENVLEYASYGMGVAFGSWKLDFGMTPGKVSRELFQVTLTTPIWNQLDTIY